MSNTKNRPVTLYSINLDLAGIGKQLSGELGLNIPIGTGKEPDADGTFDAGDGAFISAFVATRDLMGKKLPVMNGRGHLKINLRVQQRQQVDDAPPPADDDAPPIPDIDA